MGQKPGHKKQKGQQYSSHGYEIFRTILNKTKKGNIKNTNIKSELGVNEIKNGIQWYIKMVWTHGLDMSKIFNI